MSRRDRKEDNDMENTDDVNENNHVGDEIRRYNKRLFEKKKKKVFIAGSIILAFVVGFFINGSMNSMTGYVVAGTMDSQAIGEKVVDYINDNLISGEDTVTLNSVSEASGLYIISTTYNDQGINVYASMDGKYLIFESGVIDMEEEIEEPEEPESPQPQEYTEEDLEKIGEFVGCLETKGFKIYGANWCGWTNKLVVDTFGGFDIAAPIYVECTENEELCASEEIAGYPTIKINGEVYQDSRTFEAFAQATGCEAPDVGVVQTGGSSTDGCG